MSADFLSQEEVDALLRGVTGESDEPVADEAGVEGVRPYNLATQERIVRGRMPTMEIINERFARNIRIGLFNFMRKTPEVSIGGIKVQKYSAFLREPLSYRHSRRSASHSSRSSWSIFTLASSSRFLVRPSLVIGTRNAAYHLPFVPR